MTASALQGLTGSLEERFPRMLARWTALIVALIGLLALMGWITRTGALVRLGENFPPLYPNSAIALLGAATALRAIAAGNRAIVRLGAAIALIIGGITLSQYLFGFDAGIDRIFLTGAIDLTGVRYPGRMAAGSALCMLFAGVALLSLSVRHHTDAADIVTGVLGVTVAAVGGIVLLGYLTGVLQELRHSFVAGISLSEALSLFLLGSSIVTLAWRRDMALTTLPPWSAVAVGVAGVTATVLFWKALAQYQDERLVDRLRYESAVSRQAIASQIDALIKDLSRLGRRTGVWSPRDWSADADALVRDVELYRAIAWIDSSGGVRAVAPWSGASQVELWRSTRRSAAVDTVRVHGFGTDPVSAELMDQNRILAVTLAACPEGTACSGELEGYIDLDRLFTRALAARRELCLTVSTGGRPLFAPPNGSCTDSRQRGFAYLGIGPLSWTLTAAPTPAMLRETTSPLPVALLCLGIVVSGLMATSLRLAQNSWQLARAAERRQVTLAVESPTDGIWEWNLPADRMDRSAMWRNLRYGASEPEPTLAAWAALVHPDDLSHVQHAMQEHLSGGTEALMMEYRTRAADGSWHWIVDRARIVERTAMGAPALVLGIFADVTENRAAAAALQASEQRFRTMFDSTFQFQALLDLDCVLLEANRTALEFAGLRLEQVRGRPLWETPWWAGHAEREARLRQACTEARCGATVQYQEEVSGAEGRVATVEFSVKPVLDNEGRVIQLLAEGRDITENKRMEDAVREVDALSTMGRLAARVAHEINNPLAAIQTSFMLLKDAVPPNHRYYNYVGAIEREIDRIATVTRELYGMYRAELAEKNESSVPVVISDAVALLNQLNRASSVRIQTDTSRAPTVIPHPDALVRQVVFNLIQNAVEASPVNGTVGVTAWSENGSFCLSVQDHGPGVPIAMRDRIFEDFYSTKTGLTTAGMGLGLSIVRRSLRALRGEIEIQDAPGGGADFRVRLPLT